MWEFDLSIGVLQADKCIKMIYLKTSEICESAFDIQEFGYACNYIPDDNGKIS